MEQSLHKNQDSSQQHTSCNAQDAPKAQRPQPATEVIVGGKNAGDRYRINNQIVTMVRRYIQGTLVIIFTESTTNTSKGYLAHKYNSQYLDPTTGLPCSGINHFTDTFFSLADCGAWILTKRVIQTESHDDTTAKQQVFSFVDLKRV